MAGYALRPAVPSDDEAVAHLLVDSYGTLLAPGYDADVLARAMPGLTRTNAALLSSGNFWLALSDGVVVGCGGWSFEVPGREHEPAPAGATLAHLRHFAVAPRHARRGVGRLILERCLAEAAAAGATEVEALSTLGAERFYASARLRSIKRIEVPIAGVPFAAIRMQGQI